MSILVSLQLITLMSEALPQASYMHGADTAGSIPKSWNIHISWDRNSDQIIYLGFMTGGINATKRKGSKIVFIAGLEHRDSLILFHLIKKWKKKNKPLIQLSFLEVGTRGAAVSMCSVSCQWQSAALRGRYRCPPGPRCRSCGELCPWETG